MLTPPSAGSLTLSPAGNFGTGTSNNTFGYVDHAGNTYSRQVDAALNKILFDHEEGNLAQSQTHPLSLTPEASSPDSFATARLPGGRIAGKLLIQADSR